MTINATLLVQIINFIIVYCAIRALWLKPCYAIILQQQEEGKQRERHTTNQKEAITLLKDRTQHEWRQAHLYFTTKKPEKVELEPVLFKDLPPTPLPDTKELARVEKELEDHIIQHINDTV